MHILHVYPLRICAVAAGLAAGILAGCSRPDPFPHIDYTQPGSYTGIPEGSGSTALIDSIARTIPGKTQDEILPHIWFWIHDNLTFEPEPEQELFTFQDYVRAGIYTGSASHAVIFGTLCRARGIPCIWVTAADDAWILDFLEQGEQVSYYSGYVYLECRLGDTWKLVDCYGGAVYDVYDPREPNLPKQRYAFGKAGTPYTLAMDNRPAAWLARTSDVFTGFHTDDLKTIPDESRDFLLKGFRGRRPSMGVKIKNTDDRKGVLVLYAAPDYPGARAGIEPGDIITKVDRTDITDIFQLVDIIMHKGFDARFSVTIMRGTSERVVNVHIPAAAAE